MIIPELGPAEIEDVHESQKLSEYFMEDTKKKVYIVISSGEIDGESFSDILGVYKDLEDAKETMTEDIKSIKEIWGNINQEDRSDDGLRYIGYTPDDGYSYSVCIEEWDVL